MKVYSVDIEPGSEYLLLNESYKQTLYELLQVSTALAAKTALSLYDDQPYLERTFSELRGIWPPSCQEKRDENIAIARKIWSTNVNELYSRDVKVLKIYKELSSSLLYMWRIIDKIYLTATNQIVVDGGIKAVSSFGYLTLMQAIKWNFQKSLQSDCPQEMGSLHRQLLLLADMQNNISSEVDTARNVLDEMEHSSLITAVQVSNAQDHLRNAAISKATKWPLAAAAFGAAVGSIVGVIGGPPGIILGASAGTALGGSAGKVMKDRYEYTVNQATGRVRDRPEVSQPSATESNTGDQQVGDDRGSFSYPTTGSNNQGFTFGCQGLPVKSCIFYSRNK